MRNRVADLGDFDGEDTMANQTGKLGKKTVDAARRAYNKVETGLLAVEGRRSIRRKADIVAKVTRKAAKAGAVTGAVVAAAVVVREIRKRRKMG
jgi:hypothetical protein